MPNGGWIKMRGSLLESPRLLAMARQLGRDDGFRFWLSHDSNGKVTDAALRCVTAALLLRVWSSAREWGRFDGDDLILERLELADLDGMAGAPAVGAAMAAVGWAVEDADGGGVRLPKFKEHNAPMTNAERQDKHRNGKVTEESRDSNGASVTPALQNRYLAKSPPHTPPLEERKNKNPPKPPHAERDGAVTQVAEDGPDGVCGENASTGPELVHRWQSLWFGGKAKPSRSPSELKAAGRLIEEHGAERAAAIVDASVAVLRKEWPAAKTFSAVLKYVDQIVAALDAAAAKEQRQAEDERRRAQQRAADAADDARQVELRRRWQALSADERMDIEAAVCRENAEAIERAPGVAAKRLLVEALRLEAMEQRG